MNVIEQSQVFFFISSVGFVILGLFVAVLLFYFIRAANAFNKIMEKVEKDIDTIGDTTKEMIEDMRDSAVFNFLFRKSKKYKSKKQ